ncbi:MAG: nitroreductase family protein [Gammaproteobacteria bacterium]|nr:nitroreductase family protein [Gammaproteobacteria bacterium]
MINKNLNSTDYETFINVIRKRRSVRRFEKGRSISRQVLERIAEAGRWAPSGANVQPWDFIVVEDPEMRDRVVEVFLRQADRLKKYAKGFPSVYKSYLNNTVAIFIVLGDRRWNINFPHGVTPESEADYQQNNENIFYCSIGAAIQNIQLAVTANGLTSAWLSGGGEQQTNDELSELLGYPPFLRAYGTIPIGFPAKDVSSRYRRPLQQVVHWNRYEAEKFRTDEQVQFYVDSLRPFAMYRNKTELSEWEDFEEKLGEWQEAFTTDRTNPSGKLPKLLPP